MDITLFFVLFAFLLTIVAPIWFLSLVFAIKPVFGIISIFFPPFNVYLLIKYWNRLKAPFFFNILASSLLGCVLFSGLYYESRNYEKQPANVHISQLLEGNIPANHNLLISDHFRAYSKSYYYDIYNDKNVYVPIFDIDNISGKNIAHRQGEILLFLRSKYIKNKKDFPQDGPYRKLQGLISSASNTNFKKFVAKDFADIDYQKIIIIDEDEKSPDKERLFRIALILFGCFLLFSGFFVYTFISDKKMRKKSDDQIDSSPPPLPPIKL